MQGFINVMTLIGILSVGALAGMVMVYIMEKF
jgi:hypothetical protein